MKRTIIEELAVKFILWGLLFFVGYSLGALHYKQNAKILNGCYFNNTLVECETYNSLMFLKELNDSLINKDMSQEEINILTNNLGEKYKLNIK